MSNEFQITTDYPHPLATAFSETIFFLFGLFIVLYYNYKVLSSSKYSLQ